MPKKKITKAEADNKAKIAKQPLAPTDRNVPGLSPADFPTLEGMTPRVKQPDLNYFQEYGTTGLFRLGPYIWEEWLPELQQQKGVKIYKEMWQNDAIISSIFYALEMVCRSVDWDFEPGGDSPEDEKSAEFYRTCLFNDMSVNWEDTLSEILSMFIFGWSWFELVYKKREGPHPDDPTLDSNYDDGRIGWRKWGIRTQESLLRWDFDPYGGVVAMVQLAPPYYRITEIPIEKSLLFRLKPRKGNPEGISMLRGAYRSWYLKKNIEDIEAIGVERDLAGIPIMWVPENVLLGSDGNAVAARDYYKQVITNIHRNQDEGILMPSTTYAQEDGGGKMYDITLLGPSSQRQFMTDQIISRYNKMIAMTVLADFLMLGQDQTGSYALAETRNNIFSLSVTAILDSVADTINSYAIPRLARLNADINPETLPKLTHGDIASSAAMDIANAIAQLARGGVPIPDSVDFRNKIWNILHLPTEPEPEEEIQRPKVDTMLPGATAAGGRERSSRLNVETPATTSYGTQVKSADDISNYIEKQVKEVVQKPFPNEHAARIRDPSEFESNSFRRMTRDHEGKQYSVIMGKLKGSDKMTEQTLRYPKDEWTAAEAQAHAKAHGATSFVAATGE